MRNEQESSLAVLPLRHLLASVLALFVIACGGGGSGSGADDGADAGEMHSVLVRWRAVDDVEGYVIHWGHASGAYSNALDVGAPLVDAQGVVSFLLEESGAGGTIFFALTSYDATGRMSGFSNELSAVVP